METSLKTGFVQIFSCCPKKLSCPKFGGGCIPARPPASTPMTRSVNKRWLFCCYRSAIDLTVCDLIFSVSVESRRSLKHTAWDLRPKTLQNFELNMWEEGAEAAAPAQDQNQGFFTGNIMNFERPKFDFRQENRLEALKAFKKKCGYIFKGSLVNISNERKCILLQDWLRPEGQLGLVWRWGCKRLWSDVDQAGASGKSRM